MTGKHHGEFPYPSGPRKRRRHVALVITGSVVVIALVLALAIFGAIVLLGFVLPIPG